MMGALQQSAAQRASFNDIISIGELIKSVKEGNNSSCKIKIVPQVGEGEFVIFLVKKFVLSMIVRIFATREPAKPLNDAQMCGSFFLFIHF